MNILFLSSENIYPPHGGHHLRSWNVMRILAREHRLFFGGFAQNQVDYHYIPQLRAHCESVDLFSIPRTGYNPAFLASAARNGLSRHPLVAERYYIPAAQRWLTGLLRRKAIDLVHIDMLALGLYRFIIPQVPVFLTNHNVESLRLYRWYQVEKNPLLRPFLYYQYRKLRRFEGMICPAVDRCLVVSRMDQEHLRQLCGAGNFSIVPNGVDTRFFRPMAAAVDPRHLIWVGGMGSPYNADAVDHFLAAIWPRIVQRNPAVTVEFIGESPTAELQRQAARDPRIRVSGFVQDIRQQAAAAGLFIAPIRSGSGTKVKVLNAMAQAKAVVATPVAAEGIECCDGREIAIADDPARFAERVLELVDAPERAHQMGRAARHLMEQVYDWEVIGREMLKLYAA